jgi:hypothetical protein
MNILFGDGMGHRIPLHAVVTVRQFLDHREIDLGGGLITDAPEVEVVSNDLQH